MELKLVLRLIVAGMMAAMTATLPARAELLDKTARLGGVTVKYKVVLPQGYEAAEAEKRGYIVVAPAAPDGQLFFKGGARVIPGLLKMILADYKIQDSKFHIAGPSNGGIAALHVAAANPQYFLSVTAFPGFMWEPSEAKLQAISKLCVFLYVGENDEYRWHSEMKKEVEWLRSRGTVARYQVEMGQPHRMETLADSHAGRLFDGFEETKKGCSQ